MFLSHELIFQVINSWVYNIKPFCSNSSSSNNSDNNNNNKNNNDDCNNY